MVSPIGRRLSLTETKSTLTQSFCFELAKLQVCVVIICYTLPHQVARGEGKNRLREWGICSFWSWSSTVLYCTTLTLIHHVLSSFWLCYIQFKEVKILWGAEAGCKSRGPRAWWPKHPINLALKKIQITRKIWTKAFIKTYMRCLQLL